MFTQIQNRYNNRIAYVVAVNESLDLVEIQFVDDKSFKMITIGQLHKNWMDMNISNESNNKKRGRPALSQKQKEANKRKREIASWDLNGTKEYIHNKALECGMEYYTLDNGTLFKYKLPDSTMVQFNMKVCQDYINLNMRSTLLGYPLADNNKFYHADHYYNRRLKIEKFTPTQKKLVDKIIETLSACPQIEGRGRRKDKRTRKYSTRKMTPQYEKKRGRKTKAQRKGEQQNG